MSESGDRPDPTFGAFDSARDPWARPPDQPDTDDTVKVSRDQAGGGAGEAAPDDSPSVYEPPKYDAPSYEPPTYIPPVYQPPVYEPPSYDQPSYGQPSAGQPSYDQPSYGQPSTEVQSYAPPAYPVPPAAEQSPYASPGAQVGYGPAYQQPADPYQQYGEQPYGQPVSPSYGYGYGPQPGYPGGAYGYPGSTTSGKATAVMILGIASLVTVWCYGLGIVPAIIGLAMGGSAKREIAASGGRVTGDGMVTAGRIMGWISIGLAALFIVAIVLIIAFAPDTTSSTYDGSYSGS